MTRGFAPSSFVLFTDIVTSPRLGPVLCTTAECSQPIIRDRDGRIDVLPADLMAAMFQHGTSRENDPQLHTHCAIFNSARTQEDGKWRAMHQHPVYGWAKVAGAVCRNVLAWNLHRDLGIRMEQ